MISRRRFLLGAGGALAAVGVAGAGASLTTSPGRRVLHQVGLLDGDDHDAPVASGAPDVVYETFRSAHMPAPVRFGLAEVESPAATIVCLHGKGADERFPFASIGLHRFVATARLPYTVASVDGGSGSYWHGPRRDGTDAGRMLLEDFVPRFEPAGPVVLLGWSMGGYGALLAATESPPDRFAGVVAASPAIFPTAADTAAGAFDDGADFTRHNVLARTASLRDVPIRADCGEDDPFATGTRLLLDRLPTAAGGIRPGFHDTAFWRSLVPEQLTTISSWLG